ACNWAARASSAPKRPTSTTWRWHGCWKSAGRWTGTRNSAAARTRGLTMSDALLSDPSPPPPRRRALLWAGGLALLVLVAIGLWLAFRTPPGQLQGMVDADTANVSAKITARLSALEVREGDRVKAGQVLFELDSPEVAAKAQQAQAVVDAAQAGADKADEGERREVSRRDEGKYKAAGAGAE